ncbi:STAS domain-containing protein [Streptacidiphilus sp. PAMC 29251]
MFSVETRPAGLAYVLALRGELDFHSAVQLREAAETALAGPQPPPLMVVDCTAMTFCDSSGIGCLIGIYQQLSARGGALRLAAVPASVARLFALTGLNQVMAVHDTAREALEADSAHEPHVQDARSSVPVDNREVAGR